MFALLMEPFAMNQVSIATTA